MKAYLEERAASFPGLTLAQSYVRSTRTERSRRSSSATTARSPRASCRLSAKDGYAPGDVIGQTGVESALQRLPARDAGPGPRPRRLARPAAEPAPLDDGAAAGAVGAADARHRAAARGPERASGTASSRPQQRPVGGGRRRDRRARPARRLDPRARVLAVVQPVGLLGPGHDEGARRAGPRLAAICAARQNYPGIDRALDATYPPGSAFKPLTAIAALQEHLIKPYALYPCTGTYVAPQDTSHHVFHNWDPNVNEGMDLPTALAQSCDTYFYRRRQHVLRAAARPRPAAPALGAQVRLRAARRGSTSGPR